MPTRTAPHFAKCALAAAKCAFAASLAICLPAAGASADDAVPSMFSLHGFGTLGEVHADARDADFTGNFFQPNGAGYTRSWAPGVDSKLGLQGDVRLSDKLSATLQVVSQHRYDDSWTPNIEWANVKYQFTPDFSIRGGRTVLGFFMLSDTRLVGYTYPWIRPPAEVYGESPLTNQDGIGVSYRVHVGAVTNSINVNYGQAKLKIPGGGEAKSAKRFFVTSDTLEAGPVTFRVGYVSFIVDFHTPGLDTLFGGFTQFGEAAIAYGFPTSGAQALALGDKYRMLRGSITSVGATYDPGDWLLMAEWTQVKASGVLPHSSAAYVTGGYRFGEWTPYVTLARLQSVESHESGISTLNLPPPLAAGATALNAGLAAVTGAFAPSQSSVSVGARWDFLKNTDLKVQYDRLKLGSNSSGRLGNVQPNFQPGGAVNVFGVAIDFVF